MPTSIITNHPLADIFPMMSGVEYENLKTSIQNNGLNHAIVMYDDQILDGRNRYQACADLGIAYEWVEYEGDDPLAFVLDENLHRRHLNESQRAMVAARLANMAVGDNQHTQICVTSQSEAAAMLNVSERSVSTAKKAQNELPAEVVAQIDSGEIPVSRAVNKHENDKVLNEIRTGKVIAPEGLYDVVVLDPPWEMHKIEREVRPNQVGLDYPTMTEEELRDLEIPLNESSHVFLWTTQRHLPVSIRLIESWGMKYVLTMVWHKPGGPQPFGLPQYNCEFVVYARVGTPKFIDTKAFPVCFNAPRGKHSEKPEEFYDVIRRVTGGRRLDMFNRRNIDGFDTWGNEA